MDKKKIADTLEWIFWLATLTSCILYLAFDSFHVPAMRWVIYWPLVGLICVSAYKSIAFDMHIYRVAELFYVLLATLILYC